MSEKALAAMTRLNFAPIDSKPAKASKASRLTGHGPVVASVSSKPLEPGVELHIPDMSSSGAGPLGVRAGFVPARLSGGTLLRLSMAAKDMPSDEAGKVATFETVEFVNVYVCVHTDLVLAGLTPPWLEERGFRLSPDCAVAAERPSHGSFLVFRAASLEPKRWVLGGNADALPRGRPAPGSMYFAVVTRLDPGEDDEGLQLATSPELVPRMDGTVKGDTPASAVRPRTSSEAPPASSSSAAAATDAAAPRGGALRVTAALSSGSDSGPHALASVWTFQDDSGD